MHVLCCYTYRYPQADRDEQTSVQGFLMSCLQLAVSRTKLALTSPCLAQGLLAVVLHLHRDLYRLLMSYNIHAHPLTHTGR